MIKLVFARTLMSQSAASLTMQSVGGVLRAHGIEVKECLLRRGNHLNGLLLCEDIDNFPIIYGKVNFQDYKETLSLFVELKRQNLVKRIFLFGPFCQLNSMKIMNAYKEIDGIIYNDPEKTALELAKSLMKDMVGYTWNTEIKGALWRNWKTNKIIDTYVRKDGFELNELPLPIRDIEEKEFLNIANIEFSRGCIFNCAYCHMAALKKDSYIKIQEKSAEKMVNEIKDLYTTLGKRFFIFNDSLFWKNEKDRKRISQFIDLLKLEKLDVNFMIYLSLQNFPPNDIIKSLSDVGLMRVFVGVENSNANTMKKFNKGETIKKFEDVLPILNLYNISYHIGFVIFHPTATLEEVEENIRYLKSIDKLFRVGIVVEKVRLVPGTHLYENTNKLIDDQEIDTAYSYIISDSRTEELFQGLYEMFTNTLRNSFREMESFFTSSNMIFVYARRSHIKLSTLDESIKYIEDLKNEYQDILYYYITSCINGINQHDWKRSDISSKDIHKEFIKNYWNLYYKMQVTWGKLLHIVQRDFGEKYTRMISWGKEDI